MKTAKEITAEIAAAAYAARRQPAAPSFGVWAPEGVCAPAMEWEWLVNREWELVDDGEDGDGVDYEYRLFSFLFPRRRPTIFDYVDPTGAYSGTLTIVFTDANRAQPANWQAAGSAIEYAKYETSERVEYHWDWPNGVARSS